MVNPNSSKSITLRINSPMNQVNLTKVSSLCEESWYQYMMNVISEWPENKSVVLLSERCSRSSDPSKVLRNYVVNQLPADLQQARFLFAYGMHNRENIIKLKFTNSHLESRLVNEFYTSMITDRFFDTSWHRETMWDVFNKMFSPNAIITLLTRRVMNMFIECQYTDLFVDFFNWFCALNEKSFIDVDYNFFNTSICSLINIIAGLHVMMQHQYPISAQYIVPADDGYTNNFKIVKLHPQVFINALNQMHCFIDIYNLTYTYVDEEHTSTFKNIQSHLEMRLRFIGVPMFSMQVAN